MTRRLIHPQIEEVEGKLSDNYSEFTIKHARDAIHFVTNTTAQYRLKKFGCLCR